MPARKTPITSEQARAMAAARKTLAGGGNRGGGRATILRPCPNGCGLFSARQLWRHSCPVMPLTVAQRSGK